MKINEIVEPEKLKLPTIEVGDEIMTGKFKNSKATVKGFTKDAHDQPVMKTTKGDKKVFKDRHSKLVQEDGKIVQGVNTTVDVKPGETERQAAKFGNKLTKKGPPILGGSSSHKLFNMGLGE
jgi:hypothetical protein